MIKQTLILSLIGVALTGCVVAPFDDGPYYSSSPSYGHGYNRPQWNNNNGHRPPAKPIKPPHNQPGHNGQKPPNYRPPQQTKPNYKQPRPISNGYQAKPQKMSPSYAPRLPNAQRPLRP